MKYLKVVSLVMVLLVLQACSKQEVTYENKKEFLDTLSKDTFGFFWETADSVSAQIPDRWPTKSFSSIAATGFGLTSYIIGVEKGFITRQEAANRVLKTLLFLKGLPQGEQTVDIAGHKGFFYHFIDMRTGMRFQQVELSTIDTALLMAGILSCQSYFDGTNQIENSIREISDFLYQRVEWDWALNGEKTLSMGWHPEKGFIEARWKGYNEAMLLYVLALGSPTHTIEKESWDAWTSTYQWANYFNQEHINFGPLFGHQYSHMYIDFRGIQDAYTKSKNIDYFENSRRATYANYAYCVVNPGDYAGYGKYQWGLTACDGPGNQNKVNPNIAFMGYSARGAAQHYVEDDGTIAPTAAGGSIPFAPEICVPALEKMKKNLGDKIYKQYGFIDAFNLSIEYNDGTKGWFDVDYLGIDQGPIIIQAANFENELVWNVMKKNKYIKNGLLKAGFTGGWLNNTK
ncbi:MAG: Tat pathway signal protein [Cyclobacteriaceae bacterium]|jgi:hypothetical protein|nr:Tat pathway signal protein [Cyclobacteriaceae bacterium]